MTFNTGYYLQVYAFITLISCGLMQYFTGTQSVLQISFFLTLLVVELLVMQTRDGSLRLGAQETIVLALYFSFLVLTGASTLIQGGITVAIVAFKNEIALSPVMICLPLGFCRESQIYHATHHPYQVFHAQIPVMTYQVLLIVPRRVTMRGEDEKWSSVVGTFDGDPIGGENTTTMGLFCLLIMLLEVPEYKHGLTTSKSMVPHIVLSIGLCIIGEVKFIALLSPIFLAWVQPSPSCVRDASKVNLKTLSIIVAGILLPISLSIVIPTYYYSTAFSGDPSKNSLSTFIDFLSYIFGPNYIVSTGELGHLTMSLFRLKNNDLWGLSGTLFGYGLNATNSGSTISPGFLNIIYNLILDPTSLSMLLQKVGVTGTLLFISLFIYILKVCQSKPLLILEQLNQQNLQLSSFTPAFNAFAINCLISLPYSQMLMITPMLQFLFYLSLGSSLMVHRAALRCVG